MATCGDALAPARAAARTERLESLLRAHLARLAAHPEDLAVRQEARAIARELKRRGDPAVNRGLVAAAQARAVLLALDAVDPVRTLDACEAVLVLDPDQPVAVSLLARAAGAAGLPQVAAWAESDLRTLEGPGRPADPRLAALVGSSPALRRARARLSEALDSDAPVLLLGEVGTGKGLAASMLHAAGRAGASPLRILRVDGPEEALEDELFGSAGGPGQLERPGTLLINEAQRLTPVLQARLARTIRTREVERGGQVFPANLPRVVLMAPPLEGPWPGPFVVDGLARLLLPIQLPTLRERPEDIAPLSAHLLRGERSTDGHPLRLRAAALEAFQRHGWPRNVDELADALRVLVRQHRARQSDAVPAQRAHPVEAVHAALTAALDHLFDSVADEPVTPPPPPRDDGLADRIVAGLASNDVGGLAQALVAVAERLDARWVALWRVDDAGRARVLHLGDRALADPASAQAGVFEPAPPGSVIARALAARKAISTLDAGESERDLLKVLSAGGLAPRTLLTVPVLQGNDVVGLLLAGDRVGEEFFTYADLGALGVVAAGIARGARERGLRRLPAPPARALAPREDLVSAEPPVGWGPLPARPAGLRRPRFTHEGVAAAISAAVVFSALMLGATHVFGT